MTTFIAIAADRGDKASSSSNTALAATNEAQISVIDGLQVIPGCLCFTSGCMHSPQLTCRAGTKMLCKT